MCLYTERHKQRVEAKKSDNITKNAYSLLLKCCLKYKDNLTHEFPIKETHDFTGKDYISFNEEYFIEKIRSRIPFIHIDEKNEISIPDCISDDNQYAILDLIEFFAKKMRDIFKQWNDLQYKNYEIISVFDTSDIFYKFQDEINEIFRDENLLFILTDKKIVERDLEHSVLSTSIEEDIQKIQEQGIKQLLNDAVTFIRKPNISERQSGLEKIWDAFERIKTYHQELDKKSSVQKIIKNVSRGDEALRQLFEDEFKELTNIGNEYRIRHHETNKKEIQPHFIDYLFNRCLSLISITIRHLD
ncbi:hypothetical protein P7L88_00015 [Bisgaard Taxon 10/6]|uniref:AbiJ-NTD4 domain-containing protein n=1 Tax=Exercitatus varius TaxID=67857 RepID=UPI00294B1CA7|nr:hypothetical protein [Exercitatus varius]MDG2946927.1 hypothetical protein [Exercitatus varius]